METKFYLDLVTSEHRTKPNYIAWLEVLLTPFVDAINLNQGVKEAFNLNTAVGAQLDILGKILVQPRRMDFQPTDGSSPILGDEDYRLILKAKVVKNQWKGTISDFYNFWEILLGNNLPIYLVDNQQMEPVVVVWNPQVTPMIQDFLSHGLIVPKPAGLGLGLRKVDPEHNFGFFGTEFTGFNEGTFWLPTTTNENEGE